MSAYWVARAKVTDPVAYKKYTDQVPGILERYGGTVLARGGRYQIMEGPEDFHRFIVIEFPTLEQGVACFESSEYQEAARLPPQRRGDRRERDRRGRRSDEVGLWSGDQRPTSPNYLYLSLTYL